MIPSSQWGEERETGRIARTSGVRAGGVRVRPQSELPKDRPKKSDRKKGRIGNYGNREKGARKGGWEASSKSKKKKKKRVACMYPCGRAGGGMQKESGCRGKYIKGMKGVNSTSGIK